MTSTQVAKLQYLIRSASTNIDLKLSVPMILTLATEMSAIIDNEAMALTAPKKWQTLTESLEELERTDPAVKAAKERLDQVTWELTQRPRPKRFTKGAVEHHHEWMDSELGRECPCGEESE